MTEHAASFRFGNFLQTVSLCHTDRVVHLAPVQASLSFAWTHFNPWLALTDHYGWRVKKKKRKFWSGCQICLLCAPSREKACKRLSCFRLHQLTSLPHCVSRLVLRLSSANVSDSIWVNLGPSFLSPRCSFRFLTGEFKREIYGVGRTSTSHTPRPTFQAIAISAKKVLE